MLRPDEYFRDALRPASADAEEEQRAKIRDELVEVVARRISAYQLEEPAIFFLEMHKPLAFLAGQSFLLASPLLAPFLGIERLEQISEVFSEPENVERLIQRIEELRIERQERERAERPPRRNWWPFRRRTARTKQ